MDHIKTMYIEGFKKFSELEVSFNEHMNILVGENEAGKSTILDAVKTVLNQQYKNADKALLKELFNVDSVSSFKNNPSVKTLPRILIEMELSIDPKSKNAEDFYGENNRKKTETYGIRFECSFDEELGSDLDEEIYKGKIPYEYYVLKWTTFRGAPYQLVRRPLKFLFIDTSSKDTAYSFNYYNKTLFNNIYEVDIRMDARNTFRDKLEEAFSSIGLKEIDERRKFGIDSKKVILESVLSVLEDDIPLENHGSGMESLIKTQIALDKKKSGFDVLVMEEPENHLSFANLQKMLQEISRQQETSQIIVATHNSLIASRLNLKNVLWITDSCVKGLASVDEKIATFFEKADDNGFLQLLLSKKVILVEGATEYLMVPYLYLQQNKRSIEEDAITIISCNGISYNNYLAIADATDKKVAVITDNDKDEQRIKDCSDFNEKHTLQHIFMGATINDWTWEACIYHANKEKLDEKIKVEEGAEYRIHGIKPETPVLGKMINNKVKTAYAMVTSGNQFVIPEYVKEAITWISE